MSIRIWSLPIVFLLGCGLLACNSAMAQTSNGRNTEEPVSAVDAIENPTSLSLDEEPMTEVKVEGNTTIPKSDIAKHIRTRPGRVVTAQQIKDDVDALVRTRWFVTVEPSIRRTDSGNMLVFKVVERPIILKVVYKGNKKIKTKEFDRITQLKPGQPYDVSANKECARRIEQLYREKGFAFATIELERGGVDDPECQVVFLINEGPKIKVTAVKFEGSDDNVAVESGSATLPKTEVQTKTRILWLVGGKYDPTTIKDDIDGIRNYYHGLGYFDVQITSEKKSSADDSTTEVHYQIKEGTRHPQPKTSQIRRISPIQPVDPDLKKLHLFKTRLVQSDYFDADEIGPKPTNQSLRKN